jgi:hypothetical protein
MNVGRKIIPLIDALVFHEVTKNREDAVVLLAGIFQGETPEEQQRIIDRSFRKKWPARHVSHSFFRIKALINQELSPQEEYNAGFYGHLLYCAIQGELAKRSKRIRN